MCGGDGVVCSAVGCGLCENQWWDRTQVFGKLCQNDGFGLLLPVTNYYGQYYTGFGIFLFMLIIYYGRYAPVAVLSRQMAFGFPNFLSWVFTI